MVASMQLRADSAEQVVAEVTRIVCRATGIGRGARAAAPRSRWRARARLARARQRRRGRRGALRARAARRALGRSPGHLDREPRRRRGRGRSAVPAARSCRERVRAPSPPEQPGVSRARAPLPATRGARRGRPRGSRCAAPRVIVAHWARARQPCVILARDLAGELPEIPLPPGVTIAPYDGASDEPLAGIWTSTQAARMRAHLRRRMDAGILCLAAWEGGRIVAYDLLGPHGAEDVTTSPGTCFGLNLYERRESRGRGIGLALLAASLRVRARARLLAPGDDRAGAQPAHDRRGDADARLRRRRPRRAQRAARPRALELAAARVDVQRPAARDLNISDARSGGASVPEGMRRPAPATIIATIALVLAVAPVGEAANGWVKRALYARNAGTVDGISASRVPHKGKLIVLPATGKLPASILPVLDPRPARPGGPAGADGSDGSGGSVLVATRGVRGQRGRCADRRRDALAQGRLLRARGQGQPARDARHEHARRDVPAQGRHRRRPGRRRPLLAARTTPSR